jgi:protein-disulfide isomerase
VKRLIFVAAALVLVLGFWYAASEFRERRTRQLGFLAREQAELFVRPHAPVLGAEDARVYLVEFTDPACETCAAFSPFVDQLLEAYPGRVKLVLRYAPFHQGSADVVRILEAARLQDKLWETLHLLYRTQREWTQHHQVVVDRIWPLLPQAGVDVERLRRDMDDPRITAVIEQDLADVRTLGVTKTPSFFVNGRPLEPFGLQPLVDLVASEVAAEYRE